MKAIGHTPSRSVTCTRTPAARPPQHAKAQTHNAAAKDKVDLSGESHEKGGAHKTDFAKSFSWLAKGSTGNENATAKGHAYAEGGKHHASFSAGGEANLKTQGGGQVHGQQGDTKTYAGANYDARLGAQGQLQGHSSRSEHGVESAVHGHGRLGASVDAKASLATRTGDTTVSGTYKTNNLAGAAGKFESELSIGKGHAHVKRESEGFAGAETQHNVQVKMAHGKSEVESNTTFRAAAGIKAEASHEMAVNHDGFKLAGNAGVEAGAGVGARQKFAAQNEHGSRLEVEGFGAVGGFSAEAGGEISRTQDSTTIGAKFGLELGGGCKATIKDQDLLPAVGMMVPGAAPLVGLAQHFLHK